MVLGTPEFALAMRLAGLGNSHSVTSRKEGLKLLKSIPKDETVVASAGVAVMLPELREYRNLVTVPDQAKDFGAMNDLRHIVRSAVGMDIEV